MQSILLLRMYKNLLKLDPDHIYNLMVYCTSKCTLTLTQMQLFRVPAHVHSILCNLQYTNLQRLYTIVYTRSFCSETWIMPILRDVDHYWLNKFMTYTVYCSLSGHIFFINFHDSILVKDKVQRGCGCSSIAKNFLNMGMRHRV